VNYYNEIDPKAAKRLRSLISAGFIPPGHVDERSIADVRPSDLEGFTQCHFFAGIGGWPEALRIAGVSSDTRLWTGSCPCQPFSSAGRRKGTADERHLWPVFRDLVAECKPPVVLGEQVASADGRTWLSVVRFEMEILGYAVGAADLCAAGVGAPHIRQRLWFVGLGDTNNSGSQGRQGVQERTSELLAGTTGLADWDTNPNSNPIYRIAKTHDSFWGTADWIYCRDEKWRCVEPGTFPLVDGLPERVAHLRGYGNAIVPQVAATFIKAALNL
jgi:DNA (cytosine-5)-methyltransferase 1